MSAGNAERLADALCRMRGAALKLGQMLSIQDENMMPPQVCCKRACAGAATLKTCIGAAAVARLHGVMVCNLHTLACLHGS